MTESIVDLIEEETALNPNMIENLTHRALVTRLEFL